MLEGVHFSIDDVCASLVAGFGTDGRPFHPAMRFVEEVHDRLGLSVDLYVFLSEQQTSGDLCLSDATLAWREWFGRRPKVRLGPHALCREVPPHRQSVVEQLETFDAIDRAIARIVGARNRSTWVRLHEFSECFEAAGWFRRQGVESLLTTDRAQGAWRLPESQATNLVSAGLVKFNGIEFRRSDLRLESLVGLCPEEMAKRMAAVLPNGRPAVIFTHEYELVREEVRTTAMHALELICGRASGGVPRARVARRDVAIAEEWA